MKIISENTAISISLVIMLLGGVVWLTQLHVETKANAENIKAIQAKTDINKDDLSEMKADIKVIKSMLERKDGKR